MTIERQKIAAIVLAGGQSRRMDGPDKAFIELNGQPLLARAVARIERQVSMVAVNSNRHASDFETIIDIGKYPVFADTIAGYKGPLAGVLAGMRHALSRSMELTHILTVATDTPYFPDNLAANLCAAINQDHKIALAASGGVRHPVFGLWPVSLADDLEQWLNKSDTMKVMAWVQTVGHTVVDFPFAGSHDPFFNINKPDDLQAASEMFQSVSAP